MTTDWVLRCGDGENLKRSSKYRIWGISSTPTTNKHFIKNVKPGDRLWFVKNKSQGKIVAVATYRSHNSRELGPLIDISLTNKELGWQGSGTDWSADVEVHYTELYGLNDCELLTHIKGPSSIRKYDEKCRVNLAVEYSYIVRYSKVTFEL
jgi:predicted secreted protein